MESLSLRDYGSTLTIFLPDGFDLIHLKLFAIADPGQGRHSNDLAALQPTDGELLAAARWVLSQDAGETCIADWLVTNTTQQSWKSLAKAAKSDTPVQTLFLGGGTGVRHPDPFVSACLCISASTACSGVGNGS